MVLLPIVTAHAFARSTRKEVVPVVLLQLATGTLMLSLLLRNNALVVGLPGQGSTIEILGREPSVALPTENEKEKLLLALPRTTILTRLLPRTFLGKVLPGTSTATFRPEKMVSRLFARSTTKKCALETWLAALLKNLEKIGPPELVSLAGMSTTSRIGLPSPLESP